MRGGRPLDPEDPFEATLNRLFGERIRASIEDSADLWRAIANVRWTHVNGDAVDHTLRAAGDVVASIYGSGDYMDWYPSGDAGRVADWITAGLAKEGWTCAATPRPEPPTLP